MSMHVETGSNASVIEDAWQPCPPPRVRRGWLLFLPLPILAVLLHRELPCEPQWSSNLLILALVGTIFLVGMKYIKTDR